jgi:16S rRNA (uracil1498-N3)-methyltransferase
MRGNSDRFFIKEGLGVDLLCVKDKELIRQWRKVMRLTDGDEVRLFDGSGWEYKFQISNLKSQTECDLVLIDKKYIEAKKKKVYLGFGMLKDQARMEWMMEKCTELGVDGFVPILADNCQMVLKKLKTKNENLQISKQERLEKKIIEACEQCGRVRVPEILSVTRIDDLEEDKNWQVVVLDNSVVGENNQAFKEENNVLIMVGPEGGWSEREMKLFRDKKYNFLNMNENILRAETAAVAGVLWASLIK